MRKSRWSRDLTIWVDLIAGVIAAAERHPVAAAIVGGSLIGAFVGVVVFGLIL